MKSIFFACITVIIFSCTKTEKSACKLEVCGDLGHEETTFCSNGEKGYVLSKFQYPNGCGDWLIKTSSGIFFPLNISEFQDIMKENEEVSIEYEIEPHPCNAALAIKLTCVNGKAASN